MGACGVARNTAICLASRLCKSHAADEPKTVSWPPTVLTNIDGSLKFSALMILTISV
jgi:hypothetical protein